ncbi:MAG: rod shape-determining protein MreD [Burkholderiaceae bacterium]
MIITPKTLARAPTTKMLTYSLVIGLLLNLAPWPASLPAPDVVAALLVVWNIRTPSRIGLGVAWLLGIVMDVHQGVLLGQHALAYSVLSYGAISLHRRLEGFDRAGQAVHVLGLFIVSTLVVTIVRLSAESVTPNWQVVASPLVNTLVWLAADAILLSLLSRKASPRRIVNNKPNKPSRQG